MEPIPNQDLDAIFRRSALLHDQNQIAKATLEKVKQYFSERNLGATAATLENEVAECLTRLNQSMED